MSELNEMTSLEAQLRREAQQWQRGPSRNQQRKEQARANREERERHLGQIVRVSRDPCPRCAVRADIGCEHTRGRG